MEITVVEYEKVGGLYYIEDVFEDDAKTTINELDKLNWKPVVKNGRMTQHYGYEYSYSTYKINKISESLPEFLKKYRDLLKDLCTELGLVDKKYEFNQCIVNNYYPGEGISPHTDLKTFGGVIGCFTIGSGAVMQFTNGVEAEEELYVVPNSLYIMSGEARYVWKHSMPSRKNDIVHGKKVARSRRISITFRMVNNE